MTVEFQLGISSADAVTLTPEYDYDADEKKIQSDFRTLSGRLYQHKWGDFKSWNFSVKYFGNSDASIVNSWWNTNAELLFFIVEDGSVTETNSVMLTGGRPFTKYSKPYFDKMDGKIELETY